MSEQQPNTQETTAKRGRGRPPAWESPDQMQAAVDAYFETDPDAPKTVSDLCIAINCPRQTLFDYSHKGEYSDIIARARERIMGYYERYGQTGRNGHFADRMLTRMLWPAIEQQEIKAQVSTFAELMAAVGVDDAGQPALEGQEQRALPETIDVLPERHLPTMQEAQKPHSDADNEGEAE